MRFDLFQVLFPQQLGVLRGHKKALGRYCVEKALFFQFVVGALGGDHADAQVPRKPPDGGHGLIRLQCTLNDLILDLAVDLVIDGRTALVVNKEIHRQFLPFICTCTVYTVDTQLSRGTRKVGQTKKLPPPKKGRQERSDKFTVP